jgi:hypothetical protein
MNIKKIIFIILILLLIGLGVFFFFYRDSINNVITNNFDFGTFFDTNPQSQNNNPPIDTTTEQPPIEPGVYVPPILRQISFEPISGFTSYKTKINSPITKVNEENLEVVENQEIITTTIRFQERATGHLYEVFELQPNPKQISNITVSKIYETIFTKNKDEYI